MFFASERCLTFRVSLPVFALLTFQSAGRFLKSPKKPQSSAAEQQLLWNKVISALNRRCAAICDSAGCGCQQTNWIKKYISENEHSIVELKQRWMLLLSAQNVQTGVTHSRFHWLKRKCRSSWNGWIIQRRWQRVQLNCDWVKPERILVTTRKKIFPQWDWNKNLDYLIIIKSNFWNLLLRFSRYKEIFTSGQVMWTVLLLWYLGDQ